MQGFPAKDAEPKNAANAAVLSKNLPELATSRADSHHHWNSLKADAPVRGPQTRRPADLSWISHELPAASAYVTEHLADAIREQPVLAKADDLSEKYLPSTGSDKPGHYTESPIARALQPSRVLYQPNTTAYLSAFNPSKPGSFPLQPEHSGPKNSNMQPPKPLGPGLNMSHSKPPSEQCSGVHQPAIHSSGSQTPEKFGSRPQQLDSSEFRKHQSLHPVLGSAEANAKHKGQSGLTGLHGEAEKHRGCQALRSNVQLIGTPRAAPITNFFNIEAANIERAQIPGLELSDGELEKGFQNENEPLNRPSGASSL